MSKEKSGFHTGFWKYLTQKQSQKDCDTGAFKAIRTRLNSLNSQFEFQILTKPKWLTILSLLWKKIKEHSLRKAMGKKYSAFPNRFFNQAIWQGTEIGDNWSGAVNRKLRFGDVTDEPTDQPVNWRWVRLLVTIAFWTGHTVAHFVRSLAPLTPLILHFACKCVHADIAFLQTQ